MTPGRLAWASGQRVRHRRGLQQGPYQYLDLLRLVPPCVDGDEGCPDITRDSIEPARVEVVEFCAHQNGEGLAILHRRGDCGDLRTGRDNDRCTNVNERDPASSIGQSIRPADDHNCEQAALDATRRRLARCTHLSSIAPAEVVTKGRGKAGSARQRSACAATAPMSSGVIASAILLACP